ncbi:MAG: hypothetical protein FJ161_00430 [Gammaproteobacteria bacterium]|nr:hypothetical protein [Gammaproteobacteria bacterium]
MVEMYSRICITHTHDLTENTRFALRERGIDYEHWPMVRTKANDYINVPEVDSYAIASSTSALKQIVYWKDRFSKIYCIGPETRAFAVSLGIELEKIKIPNNGSFNFVMLCHCYMNEWREKNTYWYGSHQGVLKHLAIFQENNFIQPVITHWNWPDYMNAKLLASAWNSGLIICSSISAAQALGQVHFSQDVYISLSAKRLIKYFTKQTQLIVQEQHWLSEIMYIHHES